MRTQIDTGVYIVEVAPIFRINLKPEQHPLCTHTVVVSGTVARLFRYEDMVMNHAFIVLVSEIYNTTYSPPTHMCCITSPNNDDDDDD